ncbi:MAG: DNA polymerase III subunit gamma/tau [Proteobacteria bacterium]|nr:DNA polymerase III subunit gamma/tau [Pseudomonadota bacterium]
MSMLFSEMDTAAPTPYRVLARKYRPTTFDDLIGQEAVVTILTNAILSGRIAQAYMLTGVRGIGKTTTARIIARALNCIGPDGKGGPTPKPCGTCPNCVAIGEDRHVDVLEMDAASRTGVDDIREIIEGVRYGPTSARYKIYIIDEVHMLSKNAFNALLKTLEEPPPHTKFIFATTEVRKVPVTVLSRCQRFDLRRVDTATLIAHFRNVVNWEKSQAEDEALALIARAADGSVRDGLSLLDQALVRGEGAVKTDEIRAMLGLADRARLMALFEALHQGEPATALDIATELHGLGADPLVVLHDLADITHSLSRLKAAPELMNGNEVPEMERGLAKKFGDRLGTSGLARSWQMLLKGMQEIPYAPDAHKALEMVLIRLAYAANLPSPADLVKKIQESGGVPALAPSGSGNGASTGTRGMVQGNTALSLAAATPQPQASPRREETVALARMPETFMGVVALFEEKREMALRNHLYHHVHLVNYQPGLLELRVDEKVPAQFSSDVMKHLQAWTGKRWVVSLSQDEGAATLAQQENVQKKTRWQNAEAHPVVLAALKQFPGARLVEVHHKPSAEAAPEIPAVEAVESFDEEPRNE